MLVFAVATFIVGYNGMIQVCKRIMKVSFLNANKKQHKSCLAATLKHEKLVLMSYLYKTIIIKPHMQILKSKFFETLLWVLN